MGLPFGEETQAGRERGKEEKGGMKVEETVRNRAPGELRRRVMCAEVTFDARGENVLAGEGVLLGKRPEHRASGHASWGEEERKGRKGGRRAGGRQEGKSCQKSC